MLKDTLNAITMSGKWVTQPCATRPNYTTLYNPERRMSISFCWSSGRYRVICTAMTPSKFIERVEFFKTTDAFTKQLKDWSGLYESETL